MKQSRVCLIVDHPLRDLDGLALLASELAHRGIETFLVPMYDAQEVFSLAPDLVVLNYVRFANVGFVRACDRLGIAVGVLDTEGGVRQDLELFAKQVAPFAGNVQLYCAWGRAQFAALDKGAGLPPGALRATGCPRYDWAVSPWRSAIARPEGVSGPMILVNTNFPVLRPRFQSQEKEIEQNVSGMGYDRQLVYDFIAESERARSEVIAATMALAERLPSAQILLRPHPFEDRRTYDDAFAARKNIRVDQSGSVIDWIHLSRLVVHFNCSTAIDSMLLGVEAAHLDWIDAPLLAQPTAAAVSRRVASVHELLDLAERAVEGGEIPVPPELAATRRQVIQDYFYDDDGRSTQRVADAIVDVLNRIRQRAEGGLSYAARAFGAQGSLRAAAKYGLSAIGGAGVVDGLRNRIGKGGAPAGKRFSAGEVAAIVRRVQTVAPTMRGLVVETARPRYGTMPHLTGMRSVRIGPQVNEQRAAG